jgi:hypothetical protein
MVVRRLGWVGKNIAYHRWISNFEGRRVSAKGFSTLPWRFQEEVLDFSVSGEYR